MSKNNLEGFYYNLSGGVNLSKTKVGLGINTQKLYWDDSFNVELLKNQGVRSQKGNRLVLQLENEEGICGIYEYPKNSDSFIFVTIEGKIYYYNGALKQVTLEKTLDNGVSAVSFAHFNDGVLIFTKENSSEFFKLTPTRGFSDVGALNLEGEPLKTNVGAIYASRVWLAQDSTLYFSALGSHNDWVSPDDAGYISKFFSSTSKIVALCEYNGCLAIYKQDGVYLLSGSNPGEFSISRFADLGAVSHQGVITDNNKQFFINNNGVFALEQTGDLAQIALSDNIAYNIQPLFSQFDFARASQTLATSRKTKNQVWFFVPFSSSDYLNTAWIYDYSCGAWFKRVIPYEIITAAAVNGEILTGSARGEIFQENIGNNFSSKPIEFRLSTPFFHLGLPNTRKIIENLNFILDEECDNAFKFSVSKDYIAENRTDIEFIRTVLPNTLVFVELYGTQDEFDSKWAENDDEAGFCWSGLFEETYRTEVFDSNVSVQLHIEGENAGDEFALVAIEFKEVLIDE